MYKKISFALLVFGLMTSVLTACSIEEEAGPGGPQVHMAGYNFIQDSITINKGDILTLVNDVAAAPHRIRNGSWIGITPEPKTEHGAPSIDLTFNRNDSAPIGPFTMTGTFHYYCTIHEGMNLSVIVH